jgi:SulP family sulfate permease
VISDLHRRHVVVMLAGANERVRAKLAKAGIVELVQPGNLFANLSDAMAACIERSGPRPPAG